MTLDPDRLQLWLEWAGARMWALPVDGVWPQSFHVAWPEYNIELFQVLEFRARLALRAAAPSSAEIPIMDQILSLPALCRETERRRILHRRAIVHPIRNRHIYTWHRLARDFHKDPRSLRALHRRALDEVVGKIPRETLTSLYDFMLEEVA
jgi:hypothetical protein